MTIKGIINYLRNPKLLFIALGTRGFFKWMSDETYLKIRFKIMTNYKLNIKTPKSFNEKLQWLKINERNPIFTTLVDKVKVRNYISKEIGEEYLIPLLGTWDKFDDIDFSKLPNQFVLKCNHDSGTVFVCRDKNNFNYKKAKKQLTKALNKNYYWNNREYPYKNIISKKIIAEEYMEQNNSESTSVGLIDYKFFCFNGQTEFLYISQGLQNHNTAQISFCDLHGNMLPFKRKDYNEFSKLPQMPKNFNKMINLSNQLAKKIGALFLRIDLYEINGKIYFSEFTFFPGGGMITFDTYDTDLKIGNMLNIDL